MRILIAASLLFTATPVLAQETLPPGAGVETTTRVCAPCHGVGAFRYVRRSGEAWDTTINNMIGWGMTISDADYDTVLNYLSTYMNFAPPPAAAVAKPAGR
jgi:mono/diheme cytochrome c family protein